jgi:hypothetical protein
MTTQDSTQAAGNVRNGPEDRRKPLSGLPLFSAAVLAILVLAWLHRHDGLVTPREGVGYAFGIVGALMMLALLLYPLRKRIRGMRGWGRVSDWFRWHMVLGVLGPALIVLHSNYQLKSANAAVAFFSMTVVASSGIVGRYLYGRIHAGLYGRKREAQELRAEAAADRRALGLDLREGSAAARELARFEAQSLAPTTNLGSALLRFCTVGHMIRVSRRRLAAELDAQWADAGGAPAELKARRREAHRRADHYYSAVGRAATFGLYERLFALWHVLHVPLFIILVLTAIAHVVAVNLY